MKTMLAWSRSVKGYNLARGNGLLGRNSSATATLATSTATADGVSSRVVVSRRAWEAYKKSLPPKPPRSKPPKGEEKPWPRSVQIAGYVAAGTFIPYATIWLIVSFKGLRDFFGDYLPLDWLRTHFGQVEWGAMSYVDDVERQTNNVPLDAAYSTLPGEWPYRVRLQQDEIARIESGTVPAQLYLILDSTSEQEQPMKQVPGSLRANPDSLWELIAGPSSKEQRAPDGPVVAVEFGDDSELSEKHQLTLSENVFNDNKNETYAANSQNDAASSLLQKTHIYSSWFHQPRKYGETASQARVMSDQEVEISRLEYTIEMLDRDLKDPTCTRDMDEMMAELKQSKRELSRLRWQRRLGF